MNKGEALELHQLLDIALVHLEEEGTLEIDGVDEYPNHNSVDEDRDVHEKMVLAKGAFVGSVLSGEEKEFENFVPELEKEEWSERVESEYLENVTLTEYPNYFVMEFPEKGAIKLGKSAVSKYAGFFRRWLDESFADLWYSLSRDSRNGYALNRFRCLLDDGGDFEREVYRSCIREICDYWENEYLTG